MPWVPIEIAQAFGPRGRRFWRDPGRPSGPSSRLLKPNHRPPRY